MSGLKNDHARLRDALFRAPENHNSPASAPTTLANPLIRQIPIYTLSSTDGATRETRHAWHLFLISAGTSETEDRALWHNYVSTLMVACFPNMRDGILRNQMFKEVVLSAATVADLKNWFDLYSVLLSDDQDEEFKEVARNELQTVVIDLELPPGNIPLDVDLDDVLDLPSIYGHVSLVLFTAGKTITDANRAAITQKRPGAIERKYYQGKVVASLSGSLKLSNIAHTQIHSAFVALMHLRKEVFTKVATFGSAADTDPSIEIVATTTRLMRYQGMQQAVIIDQFLSSHDEAFEVPILIPSIQAYSASMRDLMAAPIEQRPYYKIIHGDSTRAFNRNDIANLLVVAVTDARETNPTMMQYAIPANHQLIMDKYTQFLRVIADE